MTKDKRKPAFTDTDKMPFGEHKGKAMQDVPPKYLVWFWGELCKEGFNKASVGPILPEHISSKVKLANYIWNSQDAIAMETGEKL